jgi:aminopeptidase N
LSKFVDAIADDWFYITKHGIAYYEEIFSTPYPFDKLDQTFIPDYNMGAMENVGNIIYTDTYVPRDEKRTAYDI